MTTTTVILNNSMVGTIVSPGPDQFVTKLTMTKSQWPPFQVESHLPFPLPFGKWTSGRFVLRDGGGAGRRLINISTQTGALTSGDVLMAAGQAFAFRGDLVLECCSRGQVWEVDFSDTAVTSLRAA